jgi:hypothetical protein
MVTNIHHASKGPMSPHPSPLAETVTAMRAALLATPAHDWVPQAIHALILACLARILGRLEEMIRLWQAGLLPPVAQRPRTAPATSRPREARRSPDCVHHRTPAAQARDHKKTERQREEGQGISLLLLPVSPSLCENRFFSSRLRHGVSMSAAGRRVEICYPPSTQGRHLPKMALPTEWPSTP